MQLETIPPTSIYQILKWNMLQTNAIKSNITGKGVILYTPTGRWKLWYCSFNNMLSHMEYSFQYSCIKMVPIVYLFILGVVLAKVQDTIPEDLNVSWDFIFPGLILVRKHVKKIANSISNTDYGEKMQLPLTGLAVGSILFHSIFIFAFN